MPPDHAAAETAARHLVRRVPTAHPEDLAGQVVEGLRAASFEAVDAVYVVDDGGAYRGLVWLRDLLAAPRDTPLGRIADSGIPPAHPEDDQERVAGIAFDSAAPAVPVVDGAGRLLGAVPARALIDILRREHVEDLHRLAGIRHAEPAPAAGVEAPIVRRVRDRLPWLAIGLLGSLAVTFVMSGFEQAIANRVAIAFFVPGVVYLADAIGTQTEAVTVRRLSHGRLSLGKALAGEVGAGLLIGLALAALSFPVIVAGFRDAHLALAVAAAIVVAGSVAASIGLLLPWALARAGTDPAFGSGPLATIIQDVLSLVIYFAVVRVLVP